MRTHCRLGSDGVSVRKPESLFRCRIRNSWLVRNLNRARFLVSGPKDLRESLVRRNTNDGLESTRCSTRKDLGRIIVTNCTSRLGCRAGGIQLGAAMDSRLFLGRAKLPLSWRGQQTLPRPSSQNLAGDGIESLGRRSTSTMRQHRRGSCSGVSPRL